MSNCSKSRRDILFIQERAQFPSNTQYQVVVEEKEETERRRKWKCLVCLICVIVHGTAHDLKVQAYYASHAIVLYYYNTMA